MKKIIAVALVVLIVASLAIIPIQARLDEEKYGALARRHNEQVWGHEEEAGAADFVGVGVVLLIALGIAVWLLRRKRA